MKFRMFTGTVGQKVAVNVDAVAWIEENGDFTIIYFKTAGYVNVKEDYQTVLTRLNTIAD